MSTLPTQHSNGDDIMESVIAKGDLSKLSQPERNRYYMEVCRSVGLNPLTRPMEYITLNGKLTLYARRDAADQLRKLNGISIEIVSRELHEGLLTVHVRAKDRDGRSDEDFGVVAMGNLKGDAAANAVLKCITKAKRRVTLSISGMGFLDETEVEDIPASAKGLALTSGNGRQSPIKPQVIAVPDHDPETGEIHSTETPDAEESEKAREWAHRMIAKINSCTSQDQLNAGMSNEKNREKMQWLNKEYPRFYELLMDAVLVKGDELSPRAPKEKVEKAINPDDTLKWIDNELGSANDLEDLTGKWVDMHKIVDDLFPPDVVEALQIYEKHKSRLGVK